MTSTTFNEYYPPYPEFPKELVENCKISKDFMPMLFEWYKYVALLIIKVASLSVIDSKRAKIHLAILKGMLNRCSRLMMASLRLASSGLYGESIRVFTRLITETAVNIEWLSTRNSDSDFNKYLAGGLQAEVKLKERIEINIADREGKLVEIEKRMLRSINRYMTLSGLSYEEIMNTSDMPDLASMYRDLDLPDEQYISVQRLGSQSIHGTWSDLLTNYLTLDDNGNFTLRDHDVVPEQTEFAACCLIILRSLSAYIIYLMEDETLRKVHIEFFGDIVTEIVNILRLTGENDFNIVNGEA